MKQRLFVLFAISLFFSCAKSEKEILLKNADAFFRESKQPVFV